MDWFLGAESVEGDYFWNLYKKGLGINVRYKRNQG